MGEWILAVVSIFGVVLNIYKNKWCFIVWAVTNFIWMLINLSREIYAQAFLFFIYFLLAIWGMFEWKIDDIKDVES